MWCEGWLLCPYWPIRTSRASAISWMVRQYAPRALPVSCVAKNSSSFAASAARPPSRFARPAPSCGTLNAVFQPLVST
jgi:hypothetical protein